MHILKSKICLLLALLLMTLGSAPQALAAGQYGSTHTTELVITKLRSLPDTQKTTSSATVNNLPIDNHASEAQGIAGISYQLVKITPTSDGDKINLSDAKSYQVTDEKWSLTTDSSGKAQVTVKDGFYILKELANPALGLTNPASPLLMRLPVVNADKNGYLDTVEIFPKSSLDPQQNPQTPGKPTRPLENPKEPVDPKIPANPEQPAEPKLLGFLPHTGDTLTTGATALGLAALTTSLSILIYRKRQKGQEHETTNEN
ncbi:MAG: LPXTG cell wall anchor domain-containing protein [Streptococcaceae bacterium]|jgi:LPXTG-motif cell wall-anchored protein|nr:LPXTG cell wall anchor domain-containing protein [Streptococcaceae bacterium]